MENMGDLIKKLRHEKNMTLEELGDKVGVGKSTVRKWENGMIANMKRDKIVKVAKALDVSPAYLMGWENKNQPEIDNGFFRVMQSAQNKGYTPEDIEIALDFLTMARERDKKEK